MGNCPHRPGALLAKPSFQRGAEVAQSHGTEVRSANISLNEVEQNGWLIIHGKVYNPASYLEEHPGGQDLLLGLAGTDVSAEFDLLRHSDFAEAILKTLYVGEFDDSDHSADHQSWFGRAGSHRQVYFTGGMHKTPRGSDSSSFWSVHDRGFLPTSDPVNKLPHPWKHLLDVCDILPALNAGYSIRHHVNTYIRHHLPDTRESVTSSLQLLSEAELECLHSTLGYVCLSYLRPPPDIYEKMSVSESDEGQPQRAHTNILSRYHDLDSLPHFLALPWIISSAMLKRKPMLDYAGCVLNNWERIDPNGPMSPGNVRMLRRFTGLIDEEWFFKTHVIIESEASHVVAALDNLVEAMKVKNMKHLLQELHDLEEALWRIASVCLPIMYARSQSDHSLLCEPFMFFFRLRPYIKSMDIKFLVDEVGSWESLHLHGPSGAMSTILPCVDTLLGIRNTSSELRETVKDFEVYVPSLHRQFQGRMYASINVKEFIESQRHCMDVTSWFALAAAFNTCVSRVLDFRWRHWNFVHNFIVRPATDTGGAQPGSACPVYHKSGSEPPANISRARMTGTGGTQFDYLQQHITDSQQSRIILSPQLQQPTPAVSTPELCAKSLPDPEPIETTFWDHSGRNGFLANRSAKLKEWANETDAPLPGCAALQRLSMMIPTFCWDFVGTSQAQLHPFLRKCEKMRGPIEALTELDEFGEMPVQALEICDLERTWALLLAVLSAHRYMSRLQCDASLTPCCPAGGHAAAMAGAEPCPAGQQQQQSRRDDMSALLHKTQVALAPLVGRPVAFCPEYCELVLNNWCLQAGSPEDLSSDDFRVTQHNVHLLCPIFRFLATPDEEWYRKLHLVLEAEGGRAISTAYKSTCKAMNERDSQQLIDSLRRLSEDIESLNEFQRRQYDQKDSRGEAIMMTRLRKFVADDLSDDEYASWLYLEGSSPLVPSLHAFLGLKRLEEINVLQSARTSTSRHMSQNHKEFLDELSTPSMSVRMYLLKEWRYASVERIASLEESFNGCLDSLIRYTLARQRLVLRMFPENGRVRHISEQQGQIIRQGRLPLLQMRRAVDARRMQTQVAAMHN
eukprot:TRINITY_DN5914_c0_g1_i4.p1 TRINITY_DN5914_c0_g1~~TRINITY_DN5914_c0_g1_i4.p1  ORF type:complete len:1077 (-),score=151.97 TRINITY_DN5914_c0_g1_i4:216-3446(-)